MSGITFRCMYEGCVGGTIFSGRIVDNDEGTTLDFQYAVGNDEENLRRKKMQERDKVQEMKTPLDYFILSSFTLPAIRHMIMTIKSRLIKTVILPYTESNIRLKLAQFQSGVINLNLEETEFLYNPDKFLQARGVQRRIFLYGNGESLPRDYKSLDEKLQWTLEGEYFEAQTVEVRRKISNNEDGPINVVKAGYIKKCDWLLYFGVYGKVPTIVMYTGPTNTNRQSYVAKIYATALDKDARCMNEELNNKTSECVRCMFSTDHITFSTYGEEPEAHEICGHFLLGNYNLNEDMGRMLHRYSGVREMIRVNAVPYCGMQEYWNKYFASMFTGVYTKYWYINLIPETESKIMLDIAKTSPRNRFLIGTPEMSYCLNGTVRRKKS